MKNKADYPFIFEHLERLYIQTGELETPFDYKLSPFDYLGAIDDISEMMLENNAFYNVGCEQENMGVSTVIQELKNYNESKLKADAIFDVLNDESLSLSEKNAKALAVQNGAPLDILALGVISQRFKDKKLSTEFTLNFKALIADMRATIEKQAAVAVAAKDALSENGINAQKAKVDIYLPLKDRAKELVNAGNFKSRRNAAMTIAPAILAYGKTLEPKKVILSEMQAEATITSWLKNMGLLNPKPKTKK